MQRTTNTQDLIAELRREVRRAQVAVATRDHAIGQLLGINATDHRCLDLIDQRGPMTAGALAEALRLSRSAVTTVIDRLEALRYVRRIPGRSDRREVLVELTPLLLRRDIRNACVRLMSCGSTGWTRLMSLNCKRP